MNPSVDFAGTLSRPDGTQPRPVRGRRCRDDVDRGEPRWTGSIAVHYFEGLDDPARAGSFLLDFGHQRFHIGVTSIFDGLAWFVTSGRPVDDDAATEP